MYLSDVFTVSTNLAGLPAMSLPMGFKNNLPLGLQIIGNHFDEAKIRNCQKVKAKTSKFQRQIR